MIIADEPSAPSEAPPQFPGSDRTDMGQERVE